MGIFQVKTSDIGSLFGRSKTKERLTSKENEDEQSLVDLSKSGTATKKKSTRKNSRKNKINAKFRRLQEECTAADTATPEYEPPKGFDFPEESPAIDNDTPTETMTTATDSKTSVPISIHLSNSNCDTVSTLDGSLGESVPPKNDVKKNRAALFASGKKNTKELKDSSNKARVLDLQDKSSLGCIFGYEKQKKQEFQKPTKANKMIDAKFYPLGDFPSSSDETSAPFVMPNFDKPYDRPDASKIQFTCSEEYETENDENVEKVSSIGSNNFHQFIVTKMPHLLSKQSTFESASKSKNHDETSNSPMRKAAKSIAVSLSSPVPQKLQNRMIPNGSHTKRPRHGLGDTNKSSQNTTPTKTIQKEEQSEPKTTVSKEPSPCKVLPDYVHPLVNAHSETLEEEDDAKTAKRDDFDMETFSHPTDPIMWSNSSISSKEVDTHDAVQDDLIELIRISSRRSEDEASKKPDPSPKGSGDSNMKIKSFHEDYKANKQSMKKDNKRILSSKSSTSAPSGVPNNAILGSMLFRHAHSESTTCLEQGRASAALMDNDLGSLPNQVGGLDTLEVETVSSVTEDAGSFYHENFERWNNRAHRAINNIYSTYHSASTHLMRGKRRTMGESPMTKA